MSDRSSLVAKGLRILPATDGSTLRRYSFRMGLQFPRTRLVGKILRDVGAQSVGRSEVSEILRSVFGLPHKKDSIIEARIVATGYQSGFLQARQPVGQNVRGYPLLRPGQQLAEVTAVAEHQVADDDQAPAILQRLESQIDRAARAWGVHAHSKNQLRYKISRSSYNRLHNATRTARMCRVRKGSVWPSSCSE